MRILLNIGLENNPCGMDDSLAIADGLLELRDYRTGWVCSEYNGVAERTLIVEADTALPLEEITPKVEILAELLEQECIPYYTEGKAELVYDPAYTGERYEFDVNYFEVLK